MSSSTKVVPQEEDGAESSNNNDDGGAEKKRDNVAINTMPSILDKNPKKLRYLTAKVPISFTLRQSPPPPPYTHTYRANILSYIPVLMIRYAQCSWEKQQPSRYIGRYITLSDSWYNF